MGKDERVVHCPRCGRKLKRAGTDVEYYVEYHKGLGIVAYDAHCGECDVTVGIEDRSSFEQEGKILITFT